MTDKAGSNSFQTLNGQFKETYADNIADLRPSGVVLLNGIDFIKAEKRPGNLYHQPIMLSHEHGFTYGGPLGNAFELESAVNSLHADAQVRGVEMVLRSYLSVAAASRSVNSKAAFIQETKLLVENMMKSFAKRLEVELLYGQSNIGVVDSVSTNTIVIADAEWAAGIFAAAEGMPISILNAAGTILRGSFSIQSVDMDAKSITVSTTPTGVVATDIIGFKSAISAGPAYNEFAGIHKIINNTGVLFNVDASTYSLWKGNIVDVGTSSVADTLSFAKVEEGIARAMEKGLTDEEFTVIVCPKTWKNLLTEQTAKRLYDESYDPKVMENGAKSIRFHGPNGLVQILSSIYCKEGYAYGLPLKEFQRIGSTDVTFEQPGFEGKFMRLLENHNGYEIRAYTDQALFTSKPGLCVLFRYLKS